MRRLKLTVALGAVLALALALTSLASAAGNRDKITGGSTQLTLNSAATQALSANHITLTALAPATGSGDTFTFPVRGGWVNPTNYNAVVRHEGGLSLSNGTRTVVVRQLTIISHQDKAALYGLVRGHRSERCHRVTRHHHSGRCVVVERWRKVKLARITEVSHSGTTAQGNVLLTEASARLINKLAGSRVAKAGEQIGTGSTTVQLGSSKSTTTTTTTTTTS